MSIKSHISKPRELLKVFFFVVVFLGTVNRKLELLANFWPVVYDGKY